MSESLIPEMLPARLEEVRKIAERQAACPSPTKLLAIVNELVVEVDRLRARLDRVLMVPTFDSREIQNT